MSDMKTLLSLVPEAPLFQIDWRKIEVGVLSAYAKVLSAVPQNPRYHAEGDVWTHTKMVCECLVKDEDFREFPERQRSELFLAALFHDCGKEKTTRKENGEWVSPHHALVGANFVREMLWREYGVSGTADLQNFRETVCFLIRYHMIAPYVFETEEPERRLIRVAANGALAPDFTLKMLFMLSKADSNGKISEDTEKSADASILVAELARETGCYTAPLHFSAPFTEYAYLSGRNVSPQTELYDDTKVEVILMCGLPGTGKDTWIRSHYPDRPMNSLDDIRAEFGISPVGNQQEVARIARARSKKLLRAETSFIYNATSLTPDIRAKLVSLFRSYGAYVKIIFLETNYEENMTRNLSRPDAVPESVIDRMLSKLTPPERFEAHEVEWLCI